MLLTVFLLCLLLGTVVGFLAGLLGIGGGLVIVPVLVYLLPLVDVGAENVMPMALATSLATIVITTTVAAMAHRKNNNIPWQLTKTLAIFVSIGALSGALIADALPAKALTIIFATAVTILALYMLRSIHRPKQRVMPSDNVVRAIGVIAGVIASLMGISGGAVLVPVLTYYGVQIRHAIGAATACGMLVSFFGTLGYVYTGFDNTELPDWSLGYVYLPALLGIVLTSSLLARYGVKKAADLPVAKLNQFFAIFLIIVAIKMATT